MRRQGSPGTHGAPSLHRRKADEHYVIALDQSHLRVFRETRENRNATVALRAVESVDFPAGRKSPTRQATDMAGRFPMVRGRTHGMSIDERLPMHREQDRRQATDIARQIEQFLTDHELATWDVAASANLWNRVAPSLSPGVMRRMRRTVSKDLVNQPLTSLRRRFAPPK